MPYANNDRVRIHWRETGNGEPLLLIMGLGYSSDMWHHVERELARSFRVIVFDNRGIGKSSRLPGPHLIPSMAEDAIAVLDTAGVDVANVFGLSMGGFIAQELALRYPQRLSTLGLACTACGGEHVVHAEQEVLEVLRSRAHMPPEQSVRVMFPYIYDPGTPVERIEADTVIRLANFPDPDTYLGQLEGISQWRACERLENLTVPTLILHGEHDRLVPPENSRLLAAHIPGSKLQIIRNASHIVTTDQPEIFVDRITAFISGQAN